VGTKRKERGEYQEHGKMWALKGRAEVSTKRKERGER
jgi:hypothetical protein